MACRKRLCGFMFSPVHFLCFISFALVIAFTPLVGSVHGATPDSGPWQTDTIASISVAEYTHGAGRELVQRTHLLETRRHTGSTETSYALSVQGGLRFDPEGAIAGYRFGPVPVTRDVGTERIGTQTPGFALPLHVINTTIGQVAKSGHRSGVWRQTVALNLGRYFPDTVQLTFIAAPLTAAGAATDTLRIAIKSAPFSFQAASAEEAAVRGRYRGVLVYSPSQNRLYQAVSVFDADHEGEQVRVQSLQFLSDASGSRPLVPLVDTGDFLALAHVDPPVESEWPVPSWALQTLMANETVNLAAMVSAEQATNPIGSSLAPLFARLDAECMQTAADIGRNVNPILGKVFARKCKKWASARQDFLDMLNGDNDKLAMKLFEELLDLAVDSFPPTSPIHGVKQIADLAKEIAEVTLEQLQADVAELQPFPQGPGKDMLPPPEHTPSTPQQTLPVPTTSLPPPKKGQKGPTAKEGGAGKILIPAIAAGIGVPVALKLANASGSNCGQGCGPAPTGPYGPAWWNAYKAWCECMCGIAYLNPERCER